MKHGWQAEDNDGDRPLVVYYELPEGGVVVADRLLDFAHRPVHLFLTIEPTPWLSIIECKVDLVGGSKVGVASARTRDISGADANETKMSRRSQY